MDDATQPDSQPPRRPPVKMGLRVVARHAAGRQGGRALAREVVESHRPKHLDAATRLAAPPEPPPPARPADPPAPPTPEPFAAVARTHAAPVSDEPSFSEDSQAAAYVSPPD